MGVYADPHMEMVLLLEQQQLKHIQCHDILISSCTESRPLTAAMGEFT